MPGPLSSLLFSLCSQQGCRAPVDREAMRGPWWGICVCAGTQRAPPRALLGRSIHSVAPCICIRCPPQLESQVCSRGLIHIAETSFPLSEGLRLLLCLVLVPLPAPCTHLIGILWKGPEWGTLSLPGFHPGDVTGTNALSRTVLLSSEVLPGECRSL